MSFLIPLATGAGEAAVGAGAVEAAGAAGAAELGTTSRLASFAQGASSGGKEKKTKEIKPPMRIVNY